MDNNGQAKVIHLYELLREEIQRKSKQCKEKQLENKGDKSDQDDMIIIERIALIYQNKLNLLN